ncbi:N-methyl-L-tryptophan oxidase [Pirellulales bacterium]|nr:N-methyl-L-tryptophan oxidase [Pirellulales bacterium]
MPSSPNNYDAIVVGAGGIGSAAMAELARRGLRVLGIDRLAPPHDRGSSHGQTRIIRRAYFEHPDYAPLADEAFRAWRKLEADSGTRLLVESGVLEIGPPDGVVVPGVLRAATDHGLAVENLTADDIADRWPVLLAPPGLVGVFEPDAGYLYVESCVRAQLDAAIGAGAELLSGAEVVGWSTGSNLHVATDKGNFTARRLVITAGAWAGGLLDSLAMPLEVRRKVMFWFAAAPEAQSMPCYLYELPGGVFYGMPALDDGTMKVAAHSGGAAVVDPLAEDRAATAAEIEEVEQFTRQHLAALAGQRVAESLCFYTMSPDEHFIVDRHPDDPRVVFAAGLSGHGFKFAPVLGQALADLALEGATELPVGFLSRERLG